MVSEWGKRTVMHERGDDLGFWPLALGIVFLSELVPSTLVSSADFGKVIVLHGLVEMYDELKVVKGAESKDKYEAK